MTLHDGCLLSMTQVGQFVPADPSRTLVVGKGVEARASGGMGFWRSLRQWWCWDGSPETDPFRNPEELDDDGSSDETFGHARRLETDPDDDA